MFQKNLAFHKPLHNFLISHLLNRARAQALCALISNEDPSGNCQGKFGATFGLALLRRRFLFEMRHVNFLVIRI